MSIGDSKYTSDVNWGCMLRSSQMLVAQVLIYFYLEEHLLYISMFPKLLIRTGIANSSTRQILEKTFAPGMTFQSY